MKVKKVLSDKKDNKVCTIHINDSIRNAAQKMAEEETSALIVLENNEDPLSYVGMLTGKMIMRECWKYENILDEKVENIMSRQLLVIKPDDDVTEVMAIMAQTRVRYVPIWENDKIIGIITAVDIIRSLMEEKDLTISSMREISGGTYGNKVY